MQFGTGLVCAITVVACVMLHFTLLHLLNDRLLPLFRRKSRIAVGIMVVCSVVGHLAEIWIFSVAMLLLARWNNAQLGQELELNGFNAFYYSAVSYTSLGAEPLREASLRLLTAIEALTGLILITWTASFIFIVMQRTWEGGH